MLARLAPHLAARRPAPDAASLAGQRRAFALIKGKHRPIENREDEMHQLVPDYAARDMITMVKSLPRVEAMTNLIAGIQKSSESLEERRLYDQERLLFTTELRRREALFATHERRAEERVERAISQLPAELFDEGVGAGHRAPKRLPSSMTYAALYRTQLYGRDFARVTGAGTNAMATSPYLRHNENLKPMPGVLAANPLEAERMQAAANLLFARYCHLPEKRRNPEKFSVSKTEYYMRLRKTSSVKKAKLKQMGIKK